MEDFLPAVELPSGLLAELWAACTSGSRDNPPPEYLAGDFEVANDIGKIRVHELGTEGDISIRFRVRQQRGPNAFQAASNLSLTKTELQALCDSFKPALTHCKSSPVLPEERQAMEAYTGAAVKEKTLNPQLTDFVRLECLVAADQITHKLLCKVVALVPDLVVTVRPIKGFAVVSTPMSKALLRKEYGKGFQTGFITLDQERRIVPLHQSDPKAKAYTLVGIWVSGLDADYDDTEFSLGKHGTKEERARRLAEKEDQKARLLDNWQVAAAMLRFMFSEDITSRMSPYPKPHENNVPSFLLVNFSGALPRFFEFRLKDRDNAWLLLESAHNVAREQKGLFRPLGVSLSYRKSESCVKCKFGDVVAAWQKQKVRTHSRKTRNISKENFNPNYETTEPKLIKGKYKIEKGSKMHVDMSSLQSDAEDLNCARIIRSSTEDSKPSKKHVHGDHKAKITLKEHLKPHQKSKPQEHNEALYYTKSSPMKTVGQSELITPTQKSSLDTSSNSNGMHSSFQSSNIASRGRQRVDQHAEQFPSYSGNTSLIRTPEYSAIASASKSSPYLGHIVMEQQRQIQALKQDLSYLRDMMSKMALNTSAVNSSIGRNVECSVLDGSRVDVSFKEAGKKVRLKGKGSIVVGGRLGQKTGGVYLLNKSNTQKKITIVKDNGKGIANPEEYNYPKIADIDASLSDNTIKDQNPELKGEMETIERQGKFKKDITQEINEPSTRTKSQKSKESKRGVAGESDWTMKLPTIEYNPELSSSRAPN